MLIRLCRLDGPWQVIAIEWDGPEPGDHLDVTAQAEGQLAGLGAVLPRRINVALPDGSMLKLDDHERAMTVYGDCVQYATADHVDPPEIPGKVSA